MAYRRRGTRRPKRFKRRARRTTKRRIMKRKRVGKRSMKMQPAAKVLPSAARVAASAIYKFRYMRSEKLDLANTALGLMADFPVFNLNNINDPDYRVGGGTAQPWVPVDAIYQNFVVLKSRITYTLTPLTGSNGGNVYSDVAVPAHLVYKVDNDAQWTPTLTNWTKAMIGNPRIKHKLIDMTAKKGVKFSMFYNRKKHWGVAMWRDSSSLAGLFSNNGAGGAGTNPPSSVNALVKIQGADFALGASSTALPNVNLDVCVDYVVEAFNPRDLQYTTGN